VRLICTLNGVQVIDQLSHIWPLRLFC